MMLNWYLAKEVGYPKFFYRYPIRQICKRILQIDNTIKLSNGIRMVLPRNSRFGTELFLKNGYVDWGSEEYLIKYLESDKCFLDIGANIGYYSLLLAPFCDRVYAFEPDPRSLSGLKRNAQLTNNIIIVESAVYSEPGEMQFDISGLPELSTLQKADLASDRVKVKVNTLDNFINSHPEIRVTAIKTDVEGVDFDVLLGAKKLIERDQPLILSELYPERRVFKFVKEFNYLIFGFAKPRDRSLIHLPPKFIHVTDNPKTFRCKMVFLVPPRLHSNFFGLTELK